MRIHTNVLTEADVHRATRDLPGVYASVSTHGSRSHSRSLEFSLTGNGYAKNTGTEGGSYEAGATWDEWGVVFAELFEIDPEALCGSPKSPVYRNQEDYDAKTRYRFAAGEGLPEDTHKRHTWVHAYSDVSDCTKCSASRSMGGVA